MSAFHRLHPRLQHAIVHDLGWRGLRPVQEQAIDAVLDGHNAVVLAPTAGGKTEASVFPALSRVLTEGLRPVAALYICPIRALLNNQEPRLAGYARMVGLDVFKWHGDVAASAKTAFRRDPAHLLMITPESLEVMLMSSRVDVRGLFRDLSIAIVDEVHAFAADDRGAHLVSILERLTRYCGRDVQRVGLSATVGNPAAIGRWLQGSSERPFTLVDPPRPAAERDLHLAYVEDLADAAPPLAALARGRKSLVFVESRAGAERVVRALKGRGVEVFVHHSSVSREERTHAEAQLASGTNTAIVATSTMELGIDVGDLDHVVQIGAPSSVASFLQRLGRTGRRPGTRTNATFYCDSPESLLQALAVLTLAARGWVEDVRPEDQAVHVLAHQVLALTLQQGGLSRWQVLPWLAAAAPFAGLDPRRVNALVDEMVGREILDESDGLLSLGHEGERLYGRKNFFELYAVFSTPPILLVLHGRTEVGHVQAQFLQGFDEGGPVVFRLAGRAWRVQRAEWDRARVFVKPAEGGKVPSWLGQARLLSYDLCQEMMRVLIAPRGEAAWLDRAAAAELEALREAYAGLLEEGTAPLEYDDEGVQWHTFAGGAVNRLLAAGLDALTGQKWTAGNLSLKAKEVSRVEAGRAIRALPGLDWPPLAREVAARMARGPVTKFQPCLPAAEVDSLLVDRLLDLPATLRFLATVRVSGAPLVGELDPALVHTEEALGAVAAALAEAPVLGLDVATTEAPHALCLLLLATPDRAWLVDALALRSLRRLRAALESTALPKRTPRAAFVRATLARHGLDPARLTEVPPPALGPAPAGSWATRPLSAAQRDWAAAWAAGLVGGGRGREGGG